MVFSNAHEWAVPLDILFTIASLQLFGHLHSIPGIYVPSGGMCYLVIKVVSVDYYTIGVNMGMTYGQHVHLWSLLFGATVVTFN